MKNVSQILLFHPPGWSLNYGGPHIGLPLIKSYLEKINIPCIIKDLNIESAFFNNVAISKEEIIPFEKKFNSELAYKFYFSKAEKLSSIAKRYNGDWKIKSGFNFNKCNLASSHDIKEYSNYSSPFTDFYKNKLIPEVQSAIPSVIGISVTVPSQILSAFEIFRLLRNNRYDGLLVLGGNTVTRLKDELKKDWIFDLVDGIILNQGEEALEMLWRSIQNNKSFENVPNLLWRKNGKIIYNGYKKLDKIKFSMPDFSGYPIGRYWGINYLPAISARGCYYGKCSFCSIPYSWGNNGFVGLDEPKSVVAFMSNAKKKWNINNFSFVEETMHPKSLTKIANQIITTGKDFVFEGYARFENFWLDDKFLNLLSKAGLRKVFIGMELISNNNRHQLNKNDKGYHIVDFLKRFHYHGIKVHLFTLFGYPGTTKKDAFDTIAFLLKNEKYIDTIDVSHFIYSKHTDVRGVNPLISKENDWALEYPVIPDNKNDLNTNEAKLLANGLESIIVQEKPKWTHPIYRIYSTWI